MFFKKSVVARRLKLYKKIFKRSHFKREKCWIFVLMSKQYWKQQSKGFCPEQINDRFKKVINKSDARAWCLRTTWKQLYFQSPFKNQLQLLPSFWKNNKKISRTSWPEQKDLTPIFLFAGWRLEEENFRYTWLVLWEAHCKKKMRAQLHTA